MARFTATALTLLSAIAAVDAFQAAFITPSTSRTSTRRYGEDGEVIFGGNTWKPKSETMGSTDTPDYFPDDYDPNEAPDFSEGMMGSQSTMSGGGTMGAALPGMENMGSDADIRGGIDECTEIPEGTEFIPMSVSDGDFEFNVAASGKIGEYELAIKPMCMTFEDYYAGFSKESHPSLTVSPRVGRMDRRGGEITYMTISCDPRGSSGKLEGDLVVVLPEDNSRLSYHFSVNSI